MKTIIAPHFAGGLFFSIKLKLLYGVEKLKNKKRVLGVGFDKFSK